MQVTPEEMAALKKLIFECPPNGLTSDQWVHVYDLQGKLTVYMKGGSVSGAVEVVVVPIDLFSRALLYVKMLADGGELESTTALRFCRADQEALEALWPQRAKEA